LHHLALTPSMSFKATTKGGKVLEADFGILWREENILGKSEGLIFGECKSFGEFKAEDFKRMQNLALQFPGAVLVFSTFRKSVTTSEKKELTKIDKCGRKHWKAERPLNPVCVLTGHELIGHFGPPTCWEDLGQKERFSHIVGFMQFCDATQQIHLGLNSWQEQWHKMFERRRAKRAEKL